MKTIHLGAAAMLIAAAGLASPATAGFTQVQEGGGPGDEPDTWKVLDLLLGDNNSTGGDDETDHGLTMSNFNDGTLNSISGLSRVDDFGASLTDVFWANGTVDVNATGLFFGNNEITDPDGGTPHSFGEVDSSGTATTRITSAGSTPFPASASYAAPLGSMTLFSRRNADLNGSVPAPTNSIAHSDPSLNSPQNAGELDRMVTIKIDTTIIDKLFSLVGSSKDGNGDITASTTEIDLDDTVPAFIVFFDTGTDRDFQDSIWLVQGLKPIPLPMPAAMASIGLLGLVGARRRFRA